MLPVFLLSWSFLISAFCFNLLPYNNRQPLAGVILVTWIQGFQEPDQGREVWSRKWHKLKQALAHQVLGKAAVTMEETWARSVPYQFETWQSRLSYQQSENIVYARYKSLCIVAKRYARTIDLCVMIVFLLGDKLTWCYTTCIDPLSICRWLIVLFQAILRLYPAPPSGKGV